jgi:hypothetical protein
MATWTPDPTFYPSPGLAKRRQRSWATLRAWLPLTQPGWRTSDKKSYGGKLVHCLPACRATLLRLRGLPVDTFAKGAPLT